MLFSQRFMVRRTVYCLITLALAAFLFVLSSGWFRAQVSAQRQPPIFYVSLAGNDTSDGSQTHPWATVNHAANVLRAGETVYIRAGTYTLTQQIRAKHSGTEKQWITYRAFPGETVILDAHAVKVAPPSGLPPFAHDQGTFQLEKVKYIQVKELEIINSHNSGITVRNSQHISLYNNKTKNTFSPGIGVWESAYQKVIGNTVINANAGEMSGFKDDFSETPHEAISIGGVGDFEVAYNLVQDGQKEGIDVKGASHHGTVHHNYVHHMERQALYIDSWSGVLTDIEMFHNVAHDCQGAGFALSVEGGAVAKNIQFHHNLLYDNWGTGIFFSRWGQDGLRQDVKIYNNTVHHNGYGRPNPGESFYWITGGLYLFSDHLKTIEIKHNIFSGNSGFQIGYSDRYLRNSSKIDNVLSQKEIDIDHNLVFGTNNVSRAIYAGWAPDNYANIYATNGTAALVDNPQFVNPKSGNFYLQRSSTTHPPLTVGAFPSVETPDLWWQDNFPPKFVD